MPSVAGILYEERSFMRDVQLRHFLVQMLDTLSEYDFASLIEPSLTHGLSVSL